MQRIIRFVLNNKFAVWLLTVIVAAAGLYSGFNMKMETIPSISTPVVTVTTVYPGAAPKEVAEEITEPIEQHVENLPGVDVVISSSLRNASSIQIQYNYDKNMDEAEQEVKEALANLDLPDKAKSPDVSRISFNAFPILSLSVTNENISFSELTDTVEKEIVPALEGVKGVSSVQIAGQQIKKVALHFDEDQMAKYNLDQKKVKGIIQGSAVSFPLGLIQFDDSEKSVVINGNIATLEDLKNLKIPYTPRFPSDSAIQEGFPRETGMPSKQARQMQGQRTERARDPQPMASRSLPTVKLSEVANIQVVAESDSIARTNGKRSIGIQVVKAADANTVEVANRVKETIEQLEQDHAGLQAVTIFDQGEPIEQSVETMLSKALLGALFAMAIILLFLRNFRSTVIAVISIPMSILIALLLLHWQGITLNIMTLGAMTVAIGRVVDDSIVVIENIYRRMSAADEELKGKALIREATKEMFIPILSSTIVTVAVFLPLAFVSGPIGELFFPFALTVVFALSASLLVAITLVPMLSHSFFRKGMKQRKGQKEPPGLLKHFYSTLLNHALNHKFLSFGLAVLLLAGSLFLVPAIGVSFLPSQGEKYLIATYNSEPGQTIEEVADIGQEASQFFVGRDGVETVQYSVGGRNPMSPGSSNDALFFVKYDGDFQAFEQEKQTVIDHLNQTTGAGQWGTQSFGAAAGSNTLTLLVYGETLDDVQPVVQKLLEAVEGDETFTNVDSSLSESYTEYTLIANQKKLSQYGLTAAQIGVKLSQMGTAPVLTTVKKGGEELKVYIQTDQKVYDSIEDLTDTKITSPLGKEIPISEFTRVEEGETPDTITKRGGRIYAKVSADITIDDVSKATADLQERIDRLEVPSSVDIEFGGVTQQINDSFTKLGLAMLAAVGIVYFILVVTFGGALAPFAILFSLPFTVIGGLLALYISGETISVSALIGALMLIGIVVTNAIVLIDRVAHNEKRGMTTRQALLEGGGTRLRPILMTALATVGALAPLAIGLEGGALISKGLGITVIGGLISSTLLTLVIVPVVYEFLMKFRRHHPAEAER